MPVPAVRSRVGIEAKRARAAERRFAHRSDGLVRSLDLPKGWGLAIEEAIFDDGEPSVAIADLLSAQVVADDEHKNAAGPSRRGRPNELSLVALERLSLKEGVKCSPMFP